MDGYNNNFQEQLHSYERLRSRYKFYYFLDQDDKEKLGLPELYFRTVGLIGVNTSLTSQVKKEIFLPRLKWPADRPPPKTLPLWKKAVNSIIFRKTIKKYYDILVDLGVEVDEYEELLFSDDSSDEEDLKSRRDSVQKAKGGKQMDRRSNQKGLKLPQIDPKRSNNIGKGPPKSKSVNSALEFSLALFEEQYSRVKRQRHRRKGHVFSVQEDYRQETMRMFDKYRPPGTTGLSSSMKILEDVAGFRTKTWVQRVHLGTKIARERAKRSLRSLPSLNI